VRVAQICVLYVPPRRVPLHYRAKLLLGRLPLPLFTHSRRIPTKLPILNHPRVARQLPPIGLTVTCMLPPISHHKPTVCNFAQSNTTISYPPVPFIRATPIPPFTPTRRHSPIAIFVKPMHEQYPFIPPSLRPPCLVRELLQTIAHLESDISKVSSVVSHSAPPWQHETPIFSAAASASQRN